MLQQCEPKPLVDYTAATATSDHIFATMALDTFVAFDIIVHLSVLWLSS
jgi:hypothetical protein